jgi:hypothetical protein
MGAATIPASERAPSRLGLQQRLESSRAGRLLISAFLAATLAGTLVANMPAGDLQREASKVTNPYMVAAGLDQSWTMFSPFPRTQILELEARVRYADGSVGVWRPPSDGALFGSYRDSRWRKFAEHAVLREPGSADGWPALWEPLARHVARTQQGGTAPVVSVTLVKRFADNLPPGQAGPGRTPFREQPYYTLELR